MSLSDVSHHCVVQKQSLDIPVLWHLTSSHLMSSHLFFVFQLFSARLSTSHLMSSLLFSAQLISTVLISAHLKSSPFYTFNPAKGRVHLVTWLLFWFKERAAPAALCFGGLQLSNITLLLPFSVHVNERHLFSSLVHLVSAFFRLWHLFPDFYRFTHLQVHLHSVFFTSERRTKRDMMTETPPQWMDPVETLPRPHGRTGEEDAQHLVISSHQRLALPKPSARSCPVPRANSQADGDMAMVKISWTGPTRKGKTVF